MILFAGDLGPFHTVLFKRAIGVRLQRDTHASVIAVLGGISFHFISFFFILFSKTVFPKKASKVCFRNKTQESS